MKGAKPQPRYPRLAAHHPDPTIVPQMDLKCHRAPDAVIRGEGAQLIGKGSLLTVLYAKSLMAMMSSLSLSSVAWKNIQDELRFPVCPFYSFVLSLSLP